MRKDKIPLLLTLLSNPVVGVQFCSDKMLFQEAGNDTFIAWKVLVDGIKEFHKLLDHLNSARFQEEEGWILADDEEWPFSFLNLCQTFGIKPQSLRTALIRWKELRLEESKPSTQ